MDGDWLKFLRDWGSKSVADARHGYNVRSVGTLTQSPAQHGDMPREGVLLDGNLSPHRLKDLAFEHNCARVAQQDRQDLEGLSGDVDDRAVSPEHLSGQ